MKVFEWLKSLIGIKPKKPAKAKRKYTKRTKPAEKKI